LAAGGDGLDHRGLADDVHVHACLLGGGRRGELKAALVQFAAAVVLETVETTQGGRRIVAGELGPALDLGSLGVVQRADRHPVLALAGRAAEARAGRWRSLLARS